MCCLCTSFFIDRISRTGRTRAAKVKKSRTTMSEKFDVIVIGAGAAGLMCAAEAGKRGRRVLVVDHAKKPGRKILISGGGRCNFTNYDVSANNFLCNNPHFVKSALSQYTNWDFISMVSKYGIEFEERAHGQLLDRKSVV